MPNQNIALTSPQLRRSPRQHSPSLSVQPVKAAYHLPIPILNTKQIPIKHLSTKHLLSDILQNLHHRETPDTPNNTALRHALTSCHQNFDTCLYPTLNHIYNQEGQKQTIQHLLQSDKKERWSKALSNEFGRLTQGNIHGVNFTDTMEFIFKKDVPKNKKVTYASFVCDYKPLKSEQWRVRCVVGGIDYLTRTTHLPLQQLFSILN